MKPTSEPANAARLPLLKGLILVTGLALAALSWYALTHWLRDEANITWYPPTPGCDLHSAPCLATLGDKGQLRFAVDVDGRIEALEILPLNVTVDGVEANTVKVDFIGRDMDMGLHRFTLDATGNGHFYGQGQVSICTQAVMPWRARVIVDTPDGRIGSWFDFDVLRS
ncbi:hypothetical protein QC823_09795 [Halomonas vilamensis]|uniref:Uncharacterized protein n=1 Tax=Vreelandella vilamensis TaxID=531309 RepID=A0ABU1H4P9_9GAMM|nr:hypothetical protein [Halomonas vilamensis]MDR5899279.1 hypothetical protein [Halomonas vilamensis]